MTIEEIKELIGIINDSNLSEFKLKSDDFELQIRTDKYEKYKGGHAIPQMVPIAQNQSAAPVIMPTPEKAKVQSSVVAPSNGAKDADDQGASNDENYTILPSPIVGTFYRSASPDKPPYVKVGDDIEVGQVLCIIEAMKLFNEIESEYSGRIVKVLVEDAQPVEYDQPLFLIDPAG